MFSPAMFTIMWVITSLVTNRKNVLLLSTWRTGQMARKKYWYVKVTKTFWYWDCRDQISSSWLQRWEEANLKRMSCRTEGLLITNDRTGWQHRDTCWHTAFKLVSHTPVAQPSESNIWLIFCHFSVVPEPLYWHWHLTQWTDPASH